MARNEEQKKKRKSKKILILLLPLSIVLLLKHLYPKRLDPLISELIYYYGIGNLYGCPQNS